MKLTDRACKAAKPADKPYKQADGGGLHLLIKPNGSKLWRLKYRYLGKEKSLAIGQYPLISLAEAREERDKARRLLAKNPPIDPMEERKKVKAATIRNVNNTFKAVALEWYELNKDRWSEGYAKKILRCLERNLFPYIGTTPIAEVTPPILLDTLRKVEKRGALEIASKTKQIAGMVFRYGIQTGKCEWNAAENLKGAMKSKPKEHFRTLAFKDLPDFIRALERNEARLYERTRRATWLSLYTFAGQ